MGRLDRYNKTVEIELMPLNNEWRVTNFVIGTSTVQLDAAPLDLRRSLIAMHVGGPGAGGTVYIGPHAKVDVTGPDRGFAVSDGEPFFLMNDLGQDLEIWAIAYQAGVEFLLMEAA